ncbi:unnamed protein product [Oikopleura dioica]|uniref:Uncharacterized protein n=1 Tax=Oikopleura dioica TaxID=34765 RepID=E4YRQ0_OIKDI|nr:unnamed protein product [Oikopleura dioica]
MTRSMRRSLETQDRAPNGGSPAARPSHGSAGSGGPDNHVEAAPHNVTMFKQYEARGRIHQFNKPTRGRQHQRNLGPLHVDDSRSVQQYTAASEPGALAEVDKPIRDRLWTKTSTTQPLLYLPNAEFLSAFMKGLSNLIQGVGKVNTQHFGPQPDPEQLKVEYKEYVDANLYNPPSAVREKFEAILAANDPEAMTAIYDHELPDLIQRKSYHLKVLAMKEIGPASFYDNTTGVRDVSNQSDHGLILIDGLNFDQTFQVLNSQARFLLEGNPTTLGHLDTVNFIMLRNYPGTMCESPLVLMRAGYSCATCTDSRCFLTGGCLKKVSTIAAAFFTPLEVLSLIGQRANNMAQRGLIRFIFEEKHSPGFMHYFAQALNSYGLSTLDRNAALFALPTTLNDDGLSLQMCTYAQPGLCSPGVYLEVAWPAEFKELGSTYYNDYCANSSQILAILREFGFTAELLGTNGNVYVDMSNFNQNYASVLYLYADNMMRSADGYHDRRYQTPPPVHFPKLRLPAQLQSAHRPGVMLEPNLPANVMGELRAAYNQFLARSATIDRYESGSETRLRHHQLQEALIGFNPHQFNQPLAEARRALDRVKTVLHQPLSNLNGYRRDIFLAQLVRVPRAGCEVPYCANVRCAANQDTYQRLLNLLADFQRVDELEVDWSVYSPDHFSPNSTKVMPDSEQKRIELCLRMPLPEGGRPEHQSYQEPPVLPRHLLARQFLPSNTDVRGLGKLEDRHANQAFNSPIVC